MDMVTVWMGLPLLGMGCEARTHFSGSFFRGPRSRRFAAIPRGRCPTGGVGLPHRPPPGIAGRPGALQGGAEGDANRRRQRAAGAAAAGADLGRGRPRVGAREPPSGFGLCEKSVQIALFFEKCSFCLALFCGTFFEAFRPNRSDSIVCSCSNSVYMFKFFLELCHHHQEKTRAPVFVCVCARMRIDAAECFGTFASKDDMALWGSASYRQPPNLFPALWTALLSFTPAPQFL